MAEAQRPKTSVYVPVSTLSVDSKILDIKLKILESKKNYFQFFFGRNWFDQKWDFVPLLDKSVSQKVIKFIWEV